MDQETLHNYYQGSTDVVASEKNNKVYVRYTVEDGTVLLDRWSAGDAGQWVCEATRVY
jgi:hypothetical protein